MTDDLDAAARRIANAAGLERLNQFEVTQLVHSIATALRAQRRRVWEEAATMLDDVNQPSRIGIVSRLRRLSSTFRQQAREEG